LLLLLFCLARELPFQKGDIVYIIRQVDQNWYEGEHHGRVGIFPRSYVEVRGAELRPIISSGIIASDSVENPEECLRLDTQTHSVIKSRVIINVMVSFQ